MLGMELSFDGTGLADMLREEGVLVLLTNGNVIRLVPPLILTKEECDLALEKIRLALQATAAGTVAK